ncbi:hypothetical protein ACF2JD_06615 [Aeromonas sp. A-5]|uniref:hypothetical protein n=1 Tax=Aeromonas ichthyocola TaxID=3367746 RepID=UPI0038F208E5
MLYADLYLLKPALIDAEQLIRLQSELSPDDDRHWQTMTHPERRQEYLLSRACGASCWPSGCSCPPPALVFNGPHGKPTTGQP